MASYLTNKFFFYYFIKKCMIHFFMKEFLGENFISEIKDKLYSAIFQTIHSKGGHMFTRRRKLTFPIVFSTILKLVKRSLGIE
ncbi:hypothetical protein EDM02_03400 [Candidatus Cardinium hertigii]|uniref:Uncharacterized protein n=1 Tax=Candidatus Cardinium hertigii TaxID=247481 RepID=A0A3N2QC69_9BACT|nr:hypothetical protein EDM02_03400 [Candidatus Cardinium hertigii]